MRNSVLARGYSTRLVFTLNEAILVLKTRKFTFCRHLEWELSSGRCLFTSRITATGIYENYNCTLSFFDPKKETNNEHVWVCFGRRGVCVHESMPALPSPHCKAGSDLYRLMGYPIKPMALWRAAWGHNEFLWQEVDRGQLGDRKFFTLSALFN